MQTRGSETSQYPEEQKSTEIPLVVASERGVAQTEGTCTFGVVGRRCGTRVVSRTIVERSSIEGDTPVDENNRGPSLSPSTTGHVKAGGKLGRP